MAKWQAWLASLGETPVNPGPALGKVQGRKVRWCFRRWGNPLSEFPTVKPTAWMRLLKVAK